MEQRKNRFRKIAVILMGAFVAVGFPRGIYNFIRGDLYRGFLGIATPLFLLIPPLFKKLTLGYPAKLYCLSFAFLILAYDIGCVYERFDLLPYYDKAAHLLSGILFTIVGYCLYFLLERKRKTSFGSDGITASGFALFFSCFIAVMWEMIEFFGSGLTGMDFQRVADTGVNDTMLDLLNCLAGSLISVLSFALYVKKKVRLITGPVTEDFYQALEDASLRQEKNG